MTMAAAIAFTSAAPASAQVPSNQRLAEIQSQSMQAEADHRSAAARCDLAAMTAARATLQRLATESRRAAKAAKAAGQFSAVDPQEAEAVAQLAEGAHEAAVRRRPINCNQQTDSQPSQATTGSAAPQPATQTQPGVDANDIDRLTNQQRIEGQVESILSQMDAARLRGDCDTLQKLKGDLETYLNYPGLPSRFPPGTLEGWRGRANAILKLPCPPNAAPPVESVVDDLTPTPATIIGTPQQRSSDGFGRPAKGKLFWPPALRLGLFYKALNLPRTGIGFVVDMSGDPERFAARTDRKVEGWGGSLGFDLGGAYLDSFYSEGDSSDSFDFQANDFYRSGIVYGGLSPSGSSGIAAPLDMTGSTKVSFTQYGLEFGFPFWDSGSASGKDPKSWMHARLYGYGGYSRFDLDYDMSADAMGTLFSSTYSYAQERRQDISEDYWRLGGRLRTSFALGAMSDLYVDTRAGFYYRDTDLRSFERNWSSFGPSSDRDFTLEFDDSDNDFGYEGRIEAGVGLNLTSGARVEFGGWADYRSAVGGVFNPWSGDQVFFDGLTTSLTKEDLLSYGAALRFRFDLSTVPPPPP